MNSVDTRERLFCLGMPQTGTTSLAFALQTLGYKVLHDYQTMQNISDNLSLGYTDIALGDYDAFLDFPHPGKVLDFVLSLPGTRVIYTTRSSDREWINSCLTHVLHSRVTGENTWNEIDTSSMLIEKLDLERRLETLSEGECLTYNIHTGWEPLCKWLDRPIPNVSFPRVNRSVDRLQEIVNYYQSIGNIDYSIDSTSQVLSYV